MRYVLAATGIPSDWRHGDRKDNRPGYAVKGVFNPARVRPDWKILAAAGVRPIYDNSVTGPYSDPFPILTGARWVPEAAGKGTSRQTLHEWAHRQVSG